MRKQKGFSLIELLIVVAIILIIAAIAIPNLLRARIAANEASASAHPEPTIRRRPAIKRCAAHPEAATVTHATVTTTPQREDDIVVVTCVADLPIGLRARGDVQRGRAARTAGLRGNDGKLPDATGTAVASRAQSGHRDEHAGQIIECLGLERGLGGIGDAPGGGVAVVCYGGNREDVLVVSGDERRVHGREIDLNRGVRARPSGHRDAIPVDVGRAAVVAGATPAGGGGRVVACSPRSTVTVAPGRGSRGTPTAGGEAGSEREYACL